MTNKQRLWMVLAIIAMPFFCVGTIVVDLQWISNKGPNDLGAFWITYKHLWSIYGKPNECTWKVDSFVKNNAMEEEGFYYISYDYNGHNGIEQVYYNGKEFSIEQ